MAKCADCGKEMATADSCTQNILVISRNGQIQERYLRSTYHFDEPDGRCNDCGIKHGGIHHWGCDAERCPKCGGQLISCGCFDETARDIQIDVQALNEEQMKRYEIHQPVIK